MRLFAKLEAKLEALLEGRKHSSGRTQLCAGSLGASPRSNFAGLERRVVANAAG